MHNPQSLVAKAREIAAEAHKGQVDKNGQDYMLHPSRVSTMGKTEEEKIVGLLHDVVEDSTITLEDLSKVGFSEEVVAAVDCLTKREGEEYLPYLNRIKGNALARQVKLYDLADNSSPIRLQKLAALERSKLIEKYNVASKVLKSS